MPAPIGGELIGHYRLVEQIGAGGMGVVFRAHDEQLQRDVAVKILPHGLFSDEASRRQFRKEALAVGKLNHPNIAMAFDFGQQDGVDYLVTEYIPGLNLDEKIGRQPLPQKTVLELGIQLTSGLEAAHREKIIHRDLKPGNLRLNPDGQLKILDFGLAQTVEPLDDIAETANRRSRRGPERDVALHVAGSVARRRGRRALRYLGGWSRALRDGNRQAGVP